MSCHPIDRNHQSSLNHLYLNQTRLAIFLTLLQKPCFQFNSSKIQNYIGYGRNIKVSKGIKKKYLSMHRPLVTSIHCNY